MGALDRLLRAGEGKKLRAIGALVPDINAFEPEMEALGDEGLKAKTGEFKGRLERGEEIDDLLIKSTHEDPDDPVTFKVDEKEPAGRRCSGKVWNRS